MTDSAGTGAPMAARCAGAFDARPEASTTSHASIWDVSPCGSPAAGAWWSGVGPGGAVAAGEKKKRGGGGGGGGPARHGQATIQPREQAGQVAVAALEEEVDV